MYEAKVSRIWNFYSIFCRVFHNFLHIRDFQKKIEKNKILKNKRDFEKKMNKNEILKKRRFWKKMRFWKKKEKNWDFEKIREIKVGFFGIWLKF